MTRADLIKAAAVSIQLFQSTEISLDRCLRAGVDLSLLLSVSREQEYLAALYLITGEKKPLPFV